MHIKSLIKLILSMSFVRSVVAYTYSVFFIPPYRSKCMELQYGLWAGVSSFFSTDRRQLGEKNLQPEILIDYSINTQLRQCKYEDSRYDFMMNMTSLKIVMNHWNSAVNIIVFIRQLYLDKTHQTAKILTLYECYLVSKMCVAIPAYMIRSFDTKSYSNGLPNDVSVQYQLISGVFMIVRKMIEEGESFLNYNATLTSESLYDYANKHNIFFSEKTNQVCGGSKLKIIELLSIVLNGNYDKYKITFNHIQNIDKYYIYANSSIEIELVIALIRASSRRLYLKIENMNYHHLNPDVPGNIENLKVDKIKKLDHEIASYLYILNHIFKSSGQNIFKKIAEASNKDVIASNGKMIGLTESKLMVINIIDNSLIYLLNQQTLINSYLNDSRKLKLNTKSILRIINIVPDGIL